MDYFYDQSIKYDVISFDIFNTILLRMTESPEEVFERVGSLLRIKGLLDDTISDISFRKIRKEAEKSCFQKKKAANGSEYTLREIYDEFPAFFLFSPDEAIACELQAERELTYLNPDIYALIQKLHAAGKRIFLTSDMYLNSEQIRELLVEAGFILSLVEDIIVSSEYDKNKRTGALYDVLVEHAGVRPERIIHFGDDTDADVAGARKAGIMGLKYDLFEDTPREMMIEECLGYHYPPLYSMRLLCHNRAGKRRSDFWYRQGYLTWGPVLAQYTEWVLELARKEHIRNIYPLMREGVLIGKLIRLGAEICGDDVTCKELYASRRTTSLTMYDSFDRDVFRYCLIQLGMTVSTLCSYLDIPADSVDIDGEMLIHDIRNSDLEDRLYDMLSMEETRDRINQTILRRKANLYGYLNDNFDLTKDFITCDIGFHGTISSAIDHSLQEHGHKMRTFHALVATSDPAIPYVLRGSEIIGFLQQYEEITKSLGNYCEYAESLFMGPEGSTKDYKKNGDRYEPVLQESEISRQEAAIRASFQEGVLDFARVYFTISRVKPILCCPDRLINALWRLYRCPTPEEAACYSELRYEQNIAETPYTLQPKEDYIETAGRLGTEAFNTYAKKHRISWPELYITKTDPLHCFKYGVEKNADQGLYTREMLRICDRLHTDGIQEVNVYGAGVVGKILGQLLGIYGIKPLRFIDRNKDLWGIVKIAGADVCPIESIPQDCTTPFVIASVSHVEDIADAIRARCVKAKIYCGE